MVIKIGMLVGVFFHRWKDDPCYGDYTFGAFFRRWMISYDQRKGWSRCNYFATNDAA